MMNLFADCAYGDGNCVDTWRASILPILLVVAIPIGVLIWYVRKNGWETEFSVREKEERK